MTEIFIKWFLFFQGCKARRSIHTYEGSG